MFSLQYVFFTSSCRIRKFHIFAKIRQIVYSLYPSKEITKKVYNSINNSIQIQKMDTIFMNSKNNKSSKPHVLILKFTDKLDLGRGENSIALSNLSIYYTWKNAKSFLLQHGMINLKCLMDHIPYQIFKIILSIF